jgi:hypothetical protein
VEFPHTTLAGTPIEEVEHAAGIPTADQKALKDLVGTVEEHGRLRNFLLIDGKTLLLQDQKELNRAEIIKSEKRIAGINEAYDALVERLLRDP